MRIIRPSRPNQYSGGTLERAVYLRADTAWLETALADPASRFVPFWRGRALIAPGEIPRAVLLPRPAQNGAWVFLGLVEGAPVFALDVSAPEEPPAFGVGEFADLRAMTALLPPLDAEILATARGILHWRATHKYCPACGGATVPVRGGWVLHCGGCGRENFPRIDAAVIMLVTRGGKLLLGQSHRFPPERNFYSTLAGFVEPGESLEDAVRREVLEEVGVRVGEVVYHSSQPWPFPASLMLGFYAEGLSDEIVLEVEEMRDARWFTREEIANRKALGFNLPPKDSIARRLIEDWLESE
ncbi:NAD(+) diphosphatase [Acidocella aromatica]|uniref:NAD(+) diphosphatase n=1 Tax=Acidocella aromatica TaxID=1303579 RepID=A0A840V7T6_9PROT|nr:NAD(+) diphosphatase [Acidocella aromatica]MBB5372028.1 NAD+ diphosphatase [Acidocella aromatica]